MENYMVKNGKGDFQLEPFSKAAGLLNFNGFSLFTHGLKFCRFNNKIDYK